MNIYIDYDIGAGIGIGVGLDIDPEIHITPIIRIIMIIIEMVPTANINNIPSSISVSIYQHQCLNQYRYQ